MNCSKCHELVDDGAAFCGNCGQAFQETPRLANFGSNTLPEYAVPRPSKHVGETKAVLSIVFGAFGIPSVFILPLLSLVLGVAGLILGVFTLKSARKKMGIIGVVLSAVAIVAGLIGWGPFYAHQRELDIKNTHVQPTKTIKSADVSTPCFSASFPEILNVSNNEGSCDVQVFNGSSLENSSNVYKVFANQEDSMTKLSFLDASKAAVEKDIKTTLPGFTITAAGSTTFAGSPAYMAKANNKAKNINVIEATVLHKTNSGYNVFVLLRLTTEKQVDLNDLETEWVWQ